MKSFWRHNLLIILALLGAAPSFAQGFSDTTSGTSESATGLSDDELQSLDQYTQKQVERFRRGRESSGKGNLGSRYSGTLEMHDSNYDGISDHENSNNSLEGGVDKAAIGKAGISNRDERNRLLSEAKEKACKSGSGGDAAKLANCVSNSSAVIIDRGSAHGGENDPHRVYELTDKATQAAKDAGSAYANQVGAEATNYDTQGLKQVEKTSRQNIVRVKTIVDGKEKIETVKIGPDIDLVRSEVAWLEDQKERNIQNGWKYYRAKRLAGGAEMSDGALGETVSKFYRDADPKNAAKQDAAFAQTVAEQAQLKIEPVCVLNGNISPKPKNGACPAGSTSSDLGEALKNETDQNKRLAAIEALKKEKKNDKDFAKNVQETRAKLANCMKEGVWCDKNMEDLAKKKGVGDPAGNAASDARELQYYNLQQASRGPLNQFERNVTSMDFNKTTDAKTQGKPYQDMQRQVREAQKAYKDFIDEERRTNPNSSYLRSGSDPNRMNARQIFGRNAARDGKTLGRSGPGAAGFIGTAPANPGSLRTNRPPQGPATRGPTLQ